MNFDQFLKKFPHRHEWGFNRQHVSRRRFFEAAGIAGSYLMLNPERASAEVKITTQDVTTINKDGPYPEAG